MIDESIILLTQFSDYSNHKLAKHMRDYMALGSSREQNVIKPFQQVFSHVIPYDFIGNLVQNGVQGANDSLIELVKAKRPKYLLWLPMSYEIRESTFQAIRAEGTIVVGWFADDETRLHNYSKWWIPYMDYCVTSDRPSVQEYEKLGAKVMLELGPSTGIPAERDWSRINEKYGVSFVGANIYDRQQFIDALLDKNIPVHLAGKGWGRFISYEEMLDIYMHSKINLNFAKTDGNKLGLKGRFFEVPLAGGFLLTEYNPEIERFYEIGKEIVCFNNIEEMIAEVQYYLEHEDERRSIARAGWERASSQYSSYQVALRIFQKIEKELYGDMDRVSFTNKMPVLPKKIRNNFSMYYLRWGAAFLIENYHRLGKETLTLSVFYNPLNIAARFFYIVAVFPPSLSSRLSELFKIYARIESWYRGSRSRLLELADMVPILGHIKRRIAQKS